MTVEGTPAARVAGVDALRGLSALAVFLCHVVAYWTFMDLPGKLPQLGALGAHGVDVFIVISGFCLMVPVVRSGGGLRVTHFWGRRAWRILPAYYVALLLAAFLAFWPVTTPTVVGRQPEVSSLLIHVVGTQTWFPGSLGSINGSLWSVSLEIQLYLTFPLLILAWRRWGTTRLLAATLVLAAIWEVSANIAVAGPAGFTLGDEHALPARMLQFVAGMWVAERALTATPRLRTWQSWVFVAASIFIASMASTLSLPDYAKATCWGAVGVSTLLTLAATRWRGALAEALERFGETAFSFYLLHQPALLLVGGLVALLPGGWIIQLGIGGLLTFVLIACLARLMFHWVEMPTHTLGRRRFPSPTPRRSASQGA